jgi:predicted 3-demethylubiquinone-9 3-methyltransferase (glyoxalase superfamily)
MSLGETYRLIAMAKLSKITPCLWFDTEGEEAAILYTSIFENSRILHVSYYGSAGPRPEGMVMTVNFELDGQEFIALNGGPEFTFDEAISFQVNCESQDEIDEFWGKLSEGGSEGPCGWLKDKFGVSWQIVPTALMDAVMRDPDSEKAQRAMKAVLGMGKIDMAEIQRAIDEGERSVLLSRDQKLGVTGPVPEPSRRRPCFQ